MAALSRRRYGQRVVGFATDENIAENRNADVAQAEYYRQELSGLRAQAHSDLARRYIELQQLQDSKLMARAADVRRIIRSLELEVITLERLGKGLERWL